MVEIPHRKKRGFGITEKHLQFGKNEFTLFQISAATVAAPSGGLSVALWQ
jgi:hypothetical protein